MKRLRNPIPKFLINYTNTQQQNIEFYLERYAKNKFWHFPNVSVERLHELTFYITELTCEW